MDDDGLNMRNWGYYEPTLKGHLGLQLMPTAADRNTRSFLSGRENAVMVTSNGAFHHRDCVVSDAPVAPMDYVRDSWMNPRDKYLNVMPGNHNYWNIPEPSGAHTFQMIHQPEAPREDRVVKVEDSSIKKEVGPLKKRGGADVPKVPKAKKPRKNSRVPKDNASASGPPRVKQAKKNFDVVINGINLDISGIPIPVCSCTGSPQQCYRWGCGGWQSACCTTSVSIYPLPMSTKRRGARIAGRKMSQGAFKKVLEKLAAEGYNFGNPIDLRTYWAKHGTNKFVTIR